jgi:hypothetical protein
MSSGHYSKTCGKPAAFATRGWSNTTIPVCRLHASAIARRSYSRGDDITFLTDEVVADAVARKAERNAAKEADRKAKAIDAAKRHASRVQREWHEYPTRYMSKLIISEGWEPGNVRALDVAVFPDNDPRAEDSFDAYHVELRDLDSIEDLPAYISIRAHTVTPYAARELMRAIEWASEIADALNAKDGDRRAD